LCIVAQVNSYWRRLSSEESIWKLLIGRNFEWLDVPMRKDNENYTWKEQYKSWSTSIWGDKRASEIGLSTDRRTATNNYCRDQEIHTGTWKSILGSQPLGVSSKSDRKRRRFNLRIDNNPYVVACGIAPATANVNLDLSGSNPSLSLFSNGNYYAYPSEVEFLTKDPNPHSFESYFARASSSKFTTGDLISIIVDMYVGVVEFRKNDTVLAHYLLPKRLTEIEWYPAVTLSRDARITLIPDFSPASSLDLSHVFLTKMDIDETKTSSSLAQ
jgi:hypothetical protein